MTSRYESEGSNPNDHTNYKFVWQMIFIHVQIFQHMAIDRTSQSPDYKRYFLIIFAAIVLLAGVIWALGAFVGIGPLATDQVISGQALDKNGEPIANAVIVVENQSGEVNLKNAVSTATLTTTTNNDGEFTTPQIATGNYTVYPRGAGSSYQYTGISPPRTNLVFAPVANGSVEKGSASG